MFDYPKIIDIASKNVISIDDSASINDAVALMHETDHRDVVITSKKSNKLKIITATDLITLRIQKIDFGEKLNQIKLDKAHTIYEDALVSDALSEIGYKKSSLCVIDKHNKLQGFVTYYDIISSIDPKTLIKQRTINEVLLAESLKSVQADTPTIDVIQMMNTSTHDCVIIYKDEEPKGLITTKDVIHYFGQNIDLSLPISHFMSSPIFTIKSTTTISVALEFIQRKNFKRLIIVDENETIIGQISQEELLARINAKWAEFIQNSQEKITQTNAQLLQKASKYEKLSSIDTLTQIMNRSKFEEVVSSEINRATRYNTETFSLIFFDIDNFKSINDIFGHHIGDEVLKTLAKTVKKHIRSSDYFARWGGEEFVVLTPLTTLKNAGIVCEQIKQSIAQIELESIKSITCSFGVTEFQIGDSIQNVFRRADDAMYQAKSQGKNSIVLM